MFRQFFIVGLYTNNVRTGTFTGVASGEWRGYFSTLFGTVLYFSIVVASVYQVLPFTCTRYCSDRSVCLEAIRAVLTAASQNSNTTKQVIFVIVTYTQREESKEQNTQKE